MCCETFMFCLADDLYLVLISNEDVEILDYDSSI